jgi:hypothetical protein
MKHDGKGREKFHNFRTSEKEILDMIYISNIDSNM